MCINRREDDVTRATAAVPTSSTDYYTGDYVLYRDADAFLSRAEGHPHTYPCRITSAGAGKHALRCLLCPPHQHTIKAEADFMRLLPVEELMADIDTAPLHAGDATQELPSAASAWLVQRINATDRQPSLTTDRQPSLQG